MEEMEALMENKFYDRNSNVFYKGMNNEMMKQYRRMMIP